MVQNNETMTELIKRLKSKDFEDIEIVEGVNFLTFNIKLDESKSESYTLFGDKK